MVIVDYNSRCGSCNGGIRGATRGSAESNMLSSARYAVLCRIGDGCPSRMPMMTWLKSSTCAELLRRQTPCSIIQMHVHCKFTTLSVQLDAAGWHQGVKTADTSRNVKWSQEGAARTWQQQGLLTIVWSTIAGLQSCPGEAANCLLAVVSSIRPSTPAPRERQGVSRMLCQQVHRGQVLARQNHTASKEMDGLPVQMRSASAVSSHCG